MKALILGGGFATRLGELTQQTPKALLDVQGQPIMWQIVEQILQQQAAGVIDEIVLVSNHHYYTAFATWLGSRNLSSRIELLDDGALTNDERLGAIGDIALVLRQKAWQDDVLVVSSDTLSSLQLGDLIAFFKKNGSAVNAVFDTHNPETIREKLGNLLLDSDGRVTDFVEKPSEPISTLTSIPYYIFARETLGKIGEYVAHYAHDDRKFLDSPGRILQWLKDLVPVYGLVVEGYYWDVGTPEALAAVRAGGLV